MADKSKPNSNSSSSSSKPRVSTRPNTTSSIRTFNKGTDKKNNTKNKK